MATQVSSLVRILGGRYGGKEEDGGGNAAALITCDLLGGCSKLGQQELDLDIHVPSNLLSVESPSRSDQIQARARAWVKGWDGTGDEPKAKTSPGEKLLMMMVSYIQEILACGYLEDA